MYINLENFLTRMGATTQMSPNNKPGISNFQFSLPELAEVTPTVSVPLYCYSIDGANFRTWTPDQTSVQDGGLLVSFKIDHIRGGAPDDHMAVLLLFGKDMKLAMARASVLVSGYTSSAFTNSGEVTPTQPGVKPAITSGGISTKISANIRGQLSSYYTLSNTGRQSIPSVVKNNIDAMVASISP